MGSLMTSMWAGVSGLQTSQNAINTTSHNITNAGTRGFVRQQILFQDFGYNKVGQSANYSHNVGMGVATEVVKQARDQFLDTRYRKEVGRQGYYESQYGAIRELEDIYGELEGVSFQKSMTDMRNALSELTKNPVSPDDISARATFVKRAEAFLERANKISAQTKDYQLNMNMQIEGKVKRINDIGENIKNLNFQIRKYESTGLERANDLRDARNSYLDELGQLIDIKYYEEPNGMVMVSAEGVPFVNDEKVFKLGLTTEKPNLKQVTDLTEQVFKLNNQIRITTNPNDLADLIDVRDEVLNRLKNYIDFTVTNDPGGNGTVTLATVDGTLLDGTDNSYITAFRKFTAEKACSTTNMLKPIWEFTGEDVFNFDRIPDQNSDTDIGSLKGLLIARGADETNYTDIPLRENYPSDETYLVAVDDYNTQVQSSVIRTSQAQFDQLIHGMVTALNNIFSPNKKLELPDGTTITVLDEEKAPVGMDPDHTQGEALFNRKDVARYRDELLTVYSVDADGNRIPDPTDPSGTGFRTEQKTVRVYNEEDPRNVDTLYTLGELEINKEILANYSKLPMTSNKNTTEFDKDVIDKLMNVFNQEFATLGPNNTVKNTFSNYYTNFVGELGNRGQTLKGISQNQEKAVMDLDNGRSNVSGVSTDEELANLIKFQHAYNANARYINVISEMLEHLVTRL